MCKMAARMLLSSSRRPYQYEIHKMKRDLNGTYEPAVFYFPNSIHPMVRKLLKFYFQSFLLGVPVTHELTLLLCDGMTHELTENCCWLSHFDWKHNRCAKL